MYIVIHLHKANSTDNEELILRCCYIPIDVCSMSKSRTRLYLKYIFIGY